MLKRNLPVLCIWISDFVSVPEGSMWIEDFFLRRALRYVFGVEGGLSRK
jgi:hypothetical protein